MARIGNLLCFVFLALTPSFSFNAPEASAPQSSDAPEEIALTSSSQPAKAAFRAGLKAFEQRQTRKAHEEFRKAIEIDPAFALAHLFAGYDSPDPAEEVEQLTAARTLASGISKGEQQMIAWLSGSRNGDYLGAITAMNDLLGQYPRDRFLGFLAGRWMIQQRNFDLAISTLERGVAFDPGYAPTLNELAYAYAYAGDFSKARSVLERYVALVPGEPNAEDSYGEVSRLAGEFGPAIAHFRKALAIDRNFAHAQVALAETCMMKGDEAEARTEFAKAVRSAATRAEKLRLETLIALTYAHDGNRAEFVKLMRAVAAEAKSADAGMLEANAYNLIAMESTDPEEIMQDGRRAEEVISRVTKITPADNDEQLASVLRTEAIQAAVEGNRGASDEALGELRMLALNSRSVFVEMTYQGTLGAALCAEGKFQDAIPHLEEDQSDPMSLARLVLAERQAGRSTEEARVLERLDKLHQPTLADLLARQLVTQAPKPKSTEAAN